MNFQIDIHVKHTKEQDEYFYNLATVVPNPIPAETGDNLIDHVNTILSQGLVEHVQHTGLGNSSVSDLGGDYNHHIFKGPDN